MKVAISQPMHDKDINTIIQEREYYIKKLNDLGFEVVDSLLKDYNENSNPAVYLGKSIELMAEADAFVFLPGWENARGCRIEYQVAKDYDKIIIILPKNNSDE